MSDKKERKRNEQWDALAELFDYQPLTASEITLWGKLTNSLRRAGATRETIIFVHDEFKKEFPRASCTPSAIEKHYSRYARLYTKKKERVLCPSCGLGGGFHLTDCTAGKVEARVNEPRASALQTPPCLKKGVVVTG